MTGVSNPAVSDNAKDWKLRPFHDKPEVELFNGLSIWLDGFHNEDEAFTRTNAENRQFVEALAKKTLADAPANDRPEAIRLTQSSKMYHV